MDIEHPSVTEDARPILGDEEIDRWRKKDEDGIKNQACELDNRKKARAVVSTDR